jgi:uncharacterized membrane protein YsdA (DUF1294 family)
MNRRVPAFILSALFLGMLLVTTQLQLLPPLILTWYLGVSAATFAAFGWDKHAARRNSWRTPERTLHLLCLVGGWPGGLLGRSVWRHKTQKQPFTALFWIAAVVNLMALLSLLTPLGLQLLTTLRQLG